MYPTVFGAIPEWQKQYKARKPYVCNNCGATIPKGMMYNCYVLRYGSMKGKSPLRKAHVHLDCAAPWYQPDATTHYLRNLGRVKPAIPEPAAVATFTPSLYLQGTAIGTVQWQPPAKLQEQLQSSPHGVSALAEMHTAVSILLHALNAATNNQKRAMQLNNLLLQMADLLDHSPTT